MNTPSKHFFIKSLIFICCLSLLFITACNNAANIPKESNSNNTPNENATEEKDTDMETQRKTQKETEKIEYSEHGLLALRSEIPVYNDTNERMFISFMNECRPNDDQMQKAWQNMVDCGITAFHSWGASQRYIGLCKKYGLDFIPFINLKNPQDMGIPGFNPSRDEDTVLGFSYWDEPNYDKIDELAHFAKNHAEKYPDKLFYVNLHPCWPEDEYVDGKTLCGHNYTEYVEHYCDVIFPHVTENRFLSVDYYPLYADGTMKTEWLYTYENIAKAAKEHDATFHFYVASTEHYGYRKLDENNLRYLVNVAMTYGADAMSYFTYATYETADNWKNSMVDTSGTVKYDEYYIAQKVNHELLNWDHVFLNFDWECTMTLEGTNGDKNPSFNRLQFSAESIDIISSASSDEDVLIGRFTGKDNEIGLMVTNFSDPINQRTAHVQLSLLDANRAIVYLRGVPTVVDVIDGNLELDIAPGDAMFVIPLAIK